jgi:polysaccharide biosynthesis protein PslF
VIEALALLRDVVPAVRYTIAGVTHPNVLSHEGDQYRDSLIQRVHSSGLAASVTFDASYRTVAELVRFVASAAIVVLPYDSKDQVTSGVLVDAVAAGCPVIATGFPHAIEMLSSGAGMVVPHGDVVALADAIRLAVSDGAVLASMAAEARRLAPLLSWSAIGHQYTEVGDQLSRNLESTSK